MTESQALELVEGFLMEQGFLPRRIDTSRLPPGKKSPDFEVLKDNNFQFLAEVKTPLHKVNPMTNMFHWTTIHSGISGRIHKAQKQFVDWDPEHAVPRILVFTSEHFQLNWMNMLDNVRGFIQRGEAMIRDLRGERYMSQSKSDIQKIDGFIWMQVGDSGDIYQLTNFLNADSPHQEKMREIVGWLKPKEESIKGQVIEFQRT